MNTQNIQRHSPLQRKILLQSKLQQDTETIARTQTMKYLHSKTISQANTQSQTSTQQTNSITLHPAFSPILSDRLCRLLKKRPVILALGSDKFTVDCFGPMTGQYLKALNTPAYIYGSLENPLNANTLPNIINLLKTKHKDTPILAIDSMIGQTSDVGKLKLIDGGIFPGSGAGKNFPQIGSVALTAIITDTSAFVKTKSVSLGLVHKLAMHAADIIHKVVISI